MLERGDRVVCGLSGGADSVCLLSVLDELKDELGITLCAAHINHGIRGDEADRDENFCRELCSRLGVELFVKRVCIPELSRELRIGEEECGRRVRYGFFNEIAGEGGKIATAHNMNDCAETLIFNLARGASLKGAGSIPPVRDNIVRPLLETDRKEIEEYLKDKGLDFVTDSTNLQNEYTRNKIRNEILPALGKINESAVRNLAYFSSLAREDEEYISGGLTAQKKETLDGDKVKTAEFLKLPVSLQRRMARDFLSELTDNEIHSKHIEAFLQFAVSNDRQSVNIADIRLKKSDGLIEYYPLNSEGFEIPVNAENCEIQYPYGRLDMRLYETKDLQNIHIKQLDNLIDYDKINSNLTLRSRRAGDSFTFAGRGVTKSLKKLFIEEKIPLYLRDRIAVLDCGGETVFTEGFGVSKKYKADENSKRILEIKIVKQEN